MRYETIDLRIEIHMRQGPVAAVISHVCFIRNDHISANTLQFKRDAEGLVPMNTYLLQLPNLDTVTLVAQQREHSPAVVERLSGVQDRLQRITLADAEKHVQKALKDGPPFDSQLPFLALHVPIKYRFTW